MKLAANLARDSHTTRHLAAIGWTVVRIWEHVPLEDAGAIVEGRLRERR
jgi:DNA mismatch endonuclease (patch repair protein)